MTDLTDSFRRVKLEIETVAQVAKRNPASVRLVAVSKTRNAAEVLALADLGQRDFGENQAAEGVAKIRACARAGLRWHFIGQLQSNKTRLVAEHFQWVHSVDRYKIAERLNDQRPPHVPALNVCLQVAVSDEPSKGGVAPDELPALAARVARLPRLRLRGLMCIPPAPEHPDDSRPYFAQLRELAAALRAQGLPVDELSMGMTADLAAAIMEGATLVRVGTAIFGPRQRHGQHPPAPEETPA